MNRPAIAVLLALATTTAAQEDPGERLMINYGPCPVSGPPNVLVILADDLGIDAFRFSKQELDATWSMLGCAFEGGLPCLPNIREIRRKGILFTEAWANPACSPTRATILTGRYSFRYGIGFPIAEGSGFDLDSETLLPEVIGASYACGAFGKWHLSSIAEPLVGCATPGAPWNHGFDSFAGQFHGVNLPYCAPVGQTIQWTKITAEPSTSGCGFDIQTGVAPSQNHLFTEHVQDAIDWIEDQGSGPWFCYLAPQAPYKNHQYPITAVGCQSIPAGEECMEETDPVLDQDAFDANLEFLDAEIGRVLTALDDQAGLGCRWWDTTTIFFIGDNGTPNNPTNVLRAPFLPDKGKETLYEGGLRVPFLIAGQSVDPVQYDGDSQELVNTVDVFPTVCTIAGVAIPPDLDGVDLTPYLGATPATGLRQYVYADYWPNVNSSCYAGIGQSVPDRAVRSRINGVDWKLHFSNDGVAANDKLFNLSMDPCEQILIPGSESMPEYVVLRDLIVQTIIDCNP